MTTKRRRGTVQQSTGAPASRNAVSPPKSVTVGDKVLGSDWMRGPPLFLPTEDDPLVSFSFKMPLSMRNTINDLAKQLSVGPTTLARMLLMQKLRALLEKGP